jgi:predicted PurR-regulated permease PerM
MNKPVLISFGVMISIIVALWQLDLSTPFLTIIFSYFVLEKLNFSKSKGFAVSLYIVLVIFAFYVFTIFVNQALDQLPRIFSSSIPIIISFAREHRIELPFSDVNSLKEHVLFQVRSHLGHLGNFARLATDEFIAVFISLVVAANMFLNPRLSLDDHEFDAQPGIRHNLYFLSCQEIIKRARTFYLSFKTVMGAQIVISSINTFFTGIFLAIMSLPLFGLVIMTTFFCGLLPIIGNILSNTVIVGIALTESPKKAIVSLIYLVAIHKLEYFLNSKIIGERIKNPAWLTLVALLIGDSIMGIPGMILAPVVLYYIKTEMSRYDTEINEL